MNRLSIARRAEIIRALVEGSSIRSVARMTRTDKDTVLRILVEFGEFCSLYQHTRLQNLSCKRIEADEIWAFVGAKEGNKTNAAQGDIWTWTAMDADSKLAVSWVVGDRSRETAHAFLLDIALRVKGRIQLSTDQLGHYPMAVANAFGAHGVDYAQIKKEYATPAGTKGSHAGRYSPDAVVIGVEKVAIFGDPNFAKISTSYVERSNLTMRMSMRRFTRLTNGFSKKAENHAHAVSMHFMFYNFCRPHTTLTKRTHGYKATPAMAAGLTDHVWTVEEILEMMEPTYMIGRAA
jgi:IS1 family transposase